MVYVFLLIAIALFAVSIKLFGGGAKIKLVVAATREARSVIRSRTLNEEAKEAAIQAAAIRMFGDALSILLRAALALVVPFAFVLLGAALGLYVIDDAARAASDWYFIIGSTIVMIGALMVTR
jgi:hypothetical protein